MANVILFAIAVLAPTIVFWGLVRLPKLVDKIGERVRSRRLVPRKPPIEQLAADLRRVHRLLVQTPDGTPMVRRVATRDAYDELLRQACLAVEGRHDLDAPPEGS